MTSSDPNAPDDLALRDPVKLRTLGSDFTTRDDAFAEGRVQEQEAGANEKTKWWKFWATLKTDSEKSDWWFASTGIPLLAATLGPLANISSLVALVTSWRMEVFIDGQIVPEQNGQPFADPRWAYYCNLASLICGFLGNIFLLFNFTQRIRYIIALPTTIVLWYLATGLLIGTTSSMDIYAPPIRPYQTYTQGFWYAIAAAAFYLLCSMLLMINMLGYFLGHYPDNFALSDSQRTLILQTMVFFIWLGGGAGVFMRIEGNSGQGWSYADSIYFCDVTILTVGFGDFYPTTNLGRGIVFPFSVGGIVTLALIVSSIYKFMRELSEENIVMKHTDRMRQQTANRTVTSSFDLRERQRAEGYLPRRSSVTEGERPSISGPSHPRAMRSSVGGTMRRATTFAPLQDTLKKKKKPKLLLLKEEKDRFRAMRLIQKKTRQYRQWLALAFSLTAFGILWCIGAVVFWQAEKNTQGLTYFKALYFCYISLLTIGYGDLAPKSSAGRCFFVIWSLIAVPTMTILVSDLGDTVVAKFKHLSDKFADFTVLPKHGIWKSFLDKHPCLLQWLQSQTQKRAEKKRLKRGFALDDPDHPAEGTQVDPEGEDLEAAEAAEAQDDGDGDVDTLAGGVTPTITQLAQQAETDALGVGIMHKHIAHHIALAIKQVSADLRLSTPKRYSFEEWVEFVRLIRLTGSRTGYRGDSSEEDEEGLVEWDWIGQDSPLMSGLDESQWLLERLCESLVRLAKKGADRRVGAATMREEAARDGRVEQSKTDNQEVYGNAKYEDGGGRDSGFEGNAILSGANGGAVEGIT